jgi:hypothetical protein
MPEMADGGHAAIETIAAAVIVVGGAIFTWLSYRSRPAPPGPAASVLAAWNAGEADDGVGTSMMRMLAGLSAGAAVIHLVAAPGHYQELGDVGAGFLVAAAFQGWWATRAWTAVSPRIAMVGIVVNIAILAAWAWTRTIGLPIGEFAGGPEPVGFPDAACAAFEIALVVLLAFRSMGIPALGAATARWRTVGRSLASIAVVPILGLVLVVTSLATYAIANGFDHGVPSGSSAGHTASH